MPQALAKKWTLWVYAVGEEEEKIEQTNSEFPLFIKDLRDAS